MSTFNAITATQNLRNNHEIMLWYTKDGYAAFKLEQLVNLVGFYASAVEISDHKVESSGPHGPSDISDASVVPAPFLNSWSFAHAKTEFFIHVFAVRAVDKQVCMISPTYQPLLPATASTLAVAACGATDSIDGEENLKHTTFVFYLSGDDNSPQALAIYTLFNENVAVMDGVSVDRSSRLCAYWEKNTSYCFYVFNKQIHRFNATTEGTDQPFKTTKNDVLSTTPMATCFYHKSRFLFFLNSQKELMWVRQTSAGKWTVIEEVKTTASKTSAPIADDNTDLAAVADEINSCIILFYTTKLNTTKYSSFVWKNPTP